MTEEMIVGLNYSNTLPNVTFYPFGIGVNAIHQEILTRIKKAYTKAQKNHREPMGTEDLFDENGKLKDKDNFRQQIYDFGIKQEALKQTVGLMFDMYDLDSTEESRTEENKKLKEYFNQITQQVDNISQEQLLQNQRFQRLFKVIDNDVDRTDRTLDAFKSKPGLTLLTKLLRSYLVYNPIVGYLQGMNDLFVPLIKLFLSEWNEEGHPVEGDRLLSDDEIDENASKIFWHFSSMVKHIKHEGLLSSVSTCNKIAEEINNILSKVNPSLTIWLKRNDLSTFLFMYSSFVMLYKRNIDDIWNVWVRIHCSKDPKHWLTYFSTAVILYVFPKIPLCENELNVKITEIYSKSFHTLNIDELSFVAKWLYEKYPIK
ncbi:TBC domain containing protein [Histomonas meleagridis]|uniref:TBC domain containing protein n=1 Tax=Histomonas meleagridis TaxID=135588 RepID=UPI003559F63E|nr:TBC domain containing protein [Histomonas meleagridis]KAH0796717.1 TBC domain containing protein [Histomonas meleagridis]